VYLVQMVYEQLSDKLAGEYGERPCLPAGGLSGAPEGPAPSAVVATALEGVLKANDPRR